MFLELTFNMFFWRGELQTSNYEIDKLSELKKFQLGTF